MKKNNLRKLLGISQENLALLLKTNRAQIAMYELGKRNLPVDAKKKLAIVLQKSKTNQANDQNKTAKLAQEVLKIKTKTKTEQKNVQKKFLQQLLLKNKHKLLMIDKKIETLTQKQNKLKNCKQFVFNFIAGIDDINDESLAVLKSVFEKTTKNFDENFFVLKKLQIKCKVLNFEIQLIQEEIENLLK